MISSILKEVKATKQIRQKETTMHFEKNGNGWITVGQFDNYSRKIVEGEIRWYVWTDRGTFRRYGDKAAQLESELQQFLTKNSDAVEKVN